MFFLKVFLKGRNGRYSSQRLVVLTHGTAMGISYMAALIFFMIEKDANSILSLINTGFLFLGAAVGIVAAFKNNNENELNKKDSNIS